MRKWCKNEKRAVCVYIKDRFSEIYLTEIYILLER